MLAPDEDGRSAFTNTIRGPWAVLGHIMQAMAIFSRMGISKSDTPGVLRTRVRGCSVVAVLLMCLVGCSQLSASRKPTPEAHAPRGQLSIGYSLLYQEADGIPKLNWILAFKDKPAQMGRVTHDLVDFYQQLADTMRRLSRQFPAMRIDVTAMSEIEAEERKAIGADLAKDFAPLVGKTGVEFEREALLMFYNTLNE
ncbi:MAG TPA: hypothetical protein VI653_08865, partial [Steroidobacteraceae bacterium]